MTDNHLLFSIHSIRAEQTLQLRCAILANGHADSCRFRGDDDKSTLHLGLYEHEEIVAVASICQEALQGSNDDTAWRLRGIAVEPRLQGYGFGGVLVRLCVEHARSLGARMVWCTARESAKRFYEALGFTSSWPPFTLPTRGDIRFYEMHYVLPGNPIADVD
jgi:GNAT superfamily N-acetyltransferase